MSVWGDALASVMERSVTKGYAWMWGLCVVSMFVWPFVPTEAFASLLRPLLMGVFGLLLVCSFAWVAETILRYLGAHSAAR